MKLEKIVALFVVLSLLLTTTVLACNTGGGDDDNNGDDGGNGNGGNGGTTPPDDGTGTTPGTDPGTGSGSGAGPEQVTSEAKESGGFYGTVAFRTPNGNLINSDFERYCYYKELMNNDSFRDWARLAYPTPFDDGELFDWAKGKKIETAQDHSATSADYELKMRSIYGLTCEQIFPPTTVVSLSAMPSLDSIAEGVAVAETYPPDQPKNGFPYAEAFAALVGFVVMGILLYRRKK